MSENQNEDNYLSIEPESISADKMSAQFLVLEQINRLNYLSTVGLANANKEKQKQIANSFVFGLTALEALVSPYLSEEYQEKSEGIKAKLLNPAGIMLTTSEHECKNTQAYSKIIENARNNPSKYYFLAENTPTICLQIAMQWFSLLLQEASKTSLYPTAQKPEKI